MLTVTDSSLCSERTLMKRINQGVSEANDNADGKLNNLGVRKEASSASLQVSIPLHP